MASNVRRKAAEVLPIRALEFFKIWNQLFGNPTPPRRIALAISGGSDSMALAYLCKQVVSERLVPDLEAKAFIVDHKARNESTEEAHRVAGWVTDLGLQSEVLTLNWQGVTCGPDGFETAARRLRYRALGEACVSFGTQTLVLGHHHDDNLEMALFRLAHRHSRWGLTGFSQRSDIPENEGRYGIEKSGSRMSFQSMYRHDPRIAEDQWRMAASEKSFPLQAGLQPFIATGGIELCRPFRMIPKSRLLATCHRAGVPYVTDPTNSDATLTERNTVRYLLASGDLPQALQPDSLSDLVKKSNEAKGNDIALADNLIQSFKILSFDLRSGCITVRFPDPPEPRHAQRKTATRTPWKQDSLLRTQALAIQRLNNLVCAVPSTYLSKHASAALPVFSGGDHNPTLGTKASPPKSFTLGSALWTPVIPLKKVRGSSGKSKPPLLPGDFSPRTEGHHPENRGRNIWRISRRPIRRSSEWPTVDFELTLPPFSSEDTNIASEWTSWQLWDSRYWVRIKAIRETQHDKDTTTNTSGSANGTEYFPATTVPITMRPFESHDLAALSQKLQQGLIKIQLPSRSNQQAIESLKGHKQFKNLLSACAPGNVRFMLPVLCRSAASETRTQTAQPQTADEQEIYGLPTLHARTTTTIRVSHPATLQTRGSDSSDPSMITKVEERKADETDGIQSSQRQEQQQQKHCGPVSYWTLTWEVQYKYIDPHLIWLTGFKGPSSETAEANEA